MVIAWSLVTVPDLFTATESSIILFIALNNLFIPSCVWQDYIYSNTTNTTINIIFHTWLNCSVREQY